MSRTKWRKEELFPEALSDLDDTEFEISVQATGSENELEGDTENEERALHSSEKL